MTYRKNSDFLYFRIELFCYLFSLDEKKSIARCQNKFEKVIRAHFYPQSMARAIYNQIFD